METARGDREEVSHGAGSLAAEDLEPQAEVVPARPAWAAFPADQVGLDQDAIADAEPGGIGPERFDRADHLVPRRVRQVDERVRPGESAQVPAADAGSGRPPQN